LEKKGGRQCLTGKHVKICWLLLWKWAATIGINYLT
jgi:hypothetical protein